MTTHPLPIPPGRALVRTVPSRRLPTVRRVALAARPLQLARVARAAGALAVGIAAEGVLRSLLAKSGGALGPAAASALPAYGTAPAAQPIDVARAVEGMRDAGRLVITEFTVVERRWRR